MGGWIGGTKAFKIVTKLVRVTKECTTAFRQTSTNCSSSCCNEQYVGQRFFQKKWRYIALIIVWFCSINIYFCTNQTITQLQLELACRQTYLLSMTSLLIHPYPLYYIKRVWIDPKQRGYGWTKTSLIVHGLNTNCYFTRLNP